MDNHFHNFYNGGFIIPSFNRDTEHGSISISFKKRGKEGDAVFLIHGLGMEKSSWNSQIGSIANAGFIAYAHDARGFGKSTRVEFPNDEEKAYDFYKLENDAADIIALMDHVGVEKGHLIGISMGGLIAQNTCIFHPDRIISATFANSFSYPHARHFSVLETLQKIGETTSLEMAYYSLIPWLLGEKTLENPMFKTVIEETKTEFLKNNTNWCMSNKIKMEKVNCSTILQKRAKEIKNPVLLIGGSDDILTPLKYLKFTESQIPHAETVIIPDVGHGSGFENPDAFNVAVIDFLKKYAINKVE